MAILLRAEEFNYLGFYSYDRPGLPVTLALAMFAFNLVRIKPDGHDWVRLRRPQTHERLLADRQRLGDKFEDELKELVTGKEFVLTQNKYPYDNAVPTGSNLLHMILWRNPTLGGVIGHEYMEDKLSELYAGYAIFFFENGRRRRSIRTVPHAQAVIDLNSYNLGL